MGKRKDYLSMIPEEYRKNIKYSGVLDACSNIEFYNSKCTHVSKITMGALLKRRQFDFCQSCYQKNSAGIIYLNKIPQQYHCNITYLDDTRGQAARVMYKNPQCGHNSITSLQCLSMKKSFLLCGPCYIKEKHRQSIDNIFLNRIPQKYHQHIEFLEDKLRDSRIIYTNPVCGHKSHITLGTLSDRCNFDLCADCSSRLRLKALGLCTVKDISEYIERIPEQYRKYIEFCEDYIGHETKIKYHNPGCGHITPNNLGTLSFRKQFEKCHDCNQCDVRARLLSNDDVISVFDKFLYDTEIIGDYIGNRNSRIRGKCKKCNSIVEGFFFNLQRYYVFYGEPQCQNCVPKNYTQNKLFDFVKNICPDAILNDRGIIKSKSGYFYELDVYCPSNKFAIEFNGLIWHSERYNKDLSYHFNKTQSCLSAGITLLHIWGDKYVENPLIYKSIIKHKLGLSTKFYARKTILKELSKDELNVFFNENHLDGNVACIVGLGLFYKDKLMQAISVRKVNSQNKKYINYLEVARSATLIDCMVVGGESKLLNHVINYARDNGFLGVLNYVSADFGGQITNKYGLEFKGYTTCSYCYTDGSRRISRQRLQKRKPGQTEREFADELKLFRVNLTPNLIYVKEFNK